jgi:glycosyltransferase involved in cell wall biosynthesis
MYKNNRIAVVMPIHNEESQIARAISRVPAFVDLILAVDDGSTDSTWQALLSLRDERVVRLRHGQNLGVGAATKSGYLHAIEAKADLIAVMDGDGQMDGDDLPALLDCAIAGADYVKGNRFLHLASISAMPACRYLGNRFFSWLTRRAADFGDPLDAQCGYTVIRRTAFKRLALEGLYDRYGFLNELFFAACRANLVVTSLPVKTIYGTEVSGINPVTAVPTILFLIAKNYARRIVRAKPAMLRLAVERAEGESAK